MTSPRPWFSSLIGLFQARRRVARKASPHSVLATFFTFFTVAGTNSERGASGPESAFEQINKMQWFLAEFLERTKQKLESENEWNSTEELYDKRDFDTIAAVCLFFVSRIQKTLH